MKEKTSYVCSECGYKTPKWMGKCPKCGNWNTFDEQTKETVTSSFVKRPSSSVIGGGEASRLKTVKTNSSERIVTGITEYDRVMGGGIVKDSVSIITSPPGGGKSTLALTIASKTAEQGLKILYASGEESEGQIKTEQTEYLTG